MESKEKLVSKANQIKNINIRKNGIKKSLKVDISTKKGTGFLDIFNVGGNNDKNRIQNDDNGNKAFNSAPN